MFPEIFAKPTVLESDQRQGSSDGGAVLLKAAEQRYGLMARMTGCLRDPSTTVVDRVRVAANRAFDSGST